MAKRENEEKKFEELMAELEIIVKDLEEGNTDLDETIKKYTEAMKIVKVCNDKLENATEAVNKILNENGELTDFEVNPE
ncbi:MAG: exodeoxyribonuclease VII small subunit [Bacilli bacterium]|nr:exodeoxyribonuclease VII small subunit [Bacilli bacterium]